MRISSVMSSVCNFVLSWVFSDIGHCFKCLLKICHGAHNNWVTSFLYLLPRRTQSYEFSGHRGMSQWPNDIHTHTSATPEAKSTVFYGLLANKSQAHLKPSQTTQSRFPYTTKKQMSRHCYLSCRLIRAHVLPSEGSILFERYQSLASGLARLLIFHDLSLYLRFDFQYYLLTFIIRNFI